MQDSMCAKVPPWYSLVAFASSVLVLSLLRSAVASVAEIGNDDLIRAMTRQTAESSGDSHFYGIVVEARVKSCFGPNHLTAAIEITHVYGGIVANNPGGFLVVQQVEGSTAAGLWRLSPPLKEGESGIWFLRQTADLQALYPAPGPPFAMPARRELRLAGYEAVRQWAEAFGRVWRAPAQGRWQMLEALSRDRTPEVSAWAIDTLARSKPKEALPLLKELVRDKDVPVAAEVLIDGFLSAGEHAFWARSLERRVLFARWMAEPLEEPAAATAIYRIHAAYCDGAVSADDLLGLMVGAMRNPGMSPDAHNDAAWVIREDYRHATEGEHGKWFDAVTNLLALSTEPKESWTLAGALNAFPLDDKQALRIRKLIPRIADSHSRELLQDALDNTNRTPKS